MSAEQIENMLGGVLDSLNVSGWRVESAHDSGGSETACMMRCPVQVQVQVSPDEIRHALAAVLAPLLDIAWAEGAREVCERVEILADWYDAQPNWQPWHIGAHFRAATTTKRAGAAARGDGDAR